jgi:prevent-host-death family protein
MAVNEHEPTAQTIEAEEARQQWDRILERVRAGSTPAIIEQDGRPVAAIISPIDLQQLLRAQAERDERFKALDAVRDAFKDVPPEEIEQEVARALQEVRRERRKEQVRVAE